MKRKETVEQYAARILANVDREPLEIQAGTPAKLKEMLQGVGHEVLTKKPSPDAWSVAQILAHLVDAEIVTAFRLRKSISESGSAIAAYDQAAWADNLRYEERDPYVSLSDFSHVRDMNLRLLRSLSPEEWERFGNHAERGKESVERLTRMMAGHDLNHLKQIDRILTQVAASASVPR